MTVAYFGGKPLHVGARCCFLRSWSSFTLSSLVVPDLAREYVNNESQLKQQKLICLVGYLQNGLQYLKEHHHVDPEERQPEQVGE